MKKYVKYLPIFLFILLHSCATRKTLVPYIDINEYAQTIISKRNKSDTILIFYNDCYCCIPGSQRDIYIFKKDTNGTQINRISNYGIYKSINGYLNWEKIFDAYKHLKTEEIKNYRFSHTDSLGRKLYSQIHSGGVNRIQLFTLNDSINKTILKHYFDQNYETALFELICRLKSILFDHDFILNQLMTKNIFNRTKLINRN